MKKRGLFLLFLYFFLAFFFALSSGRSSSVPPQAGRQAGSLLIEDVSLEIYVCLVLVYFFPPPFRPRLGEKLAELVT